MMRPPVSVPPSLLTVSARVEHRHQRPAHRSLGAVGRDRFVDLGLLPLVQADVGRLVPEQVQMIGANGKSLGTVTLKDTAGSATGERLADATRQLFDLDDPA